MIVYDTAPTTYPISLAEAKRECRIDADDTSHDLDLELYIIAATDYCQSRCRRQFVTATLKQTVRPACGYVGLDRVPVIAVSSVKDGDAVAITYTLDRSRLRPHLDLDSVPELLEIVFTAGYGTASQVPAKYKVAVAKATRHLWERSDEPMPKAINDLLDGVTWV